MWFYWSKTSAIIHITFVLNEILRGSMKIYGNICAIYKITIQCYTTFLRTSFKNNKSLEKYENSQFGRDSGI